jgi:pimeloyl-ACP methyl ester carboxylesterase
VTSDVITLPDGRRLRWHEFGEPGGSPVIYTAGTPVSGLGGGAYDQAARAAGLRWISPDKPGYGGSDFQRERSLTSWADDLAALAGHLGLHRFALAGESGGGPFTLAAAHRLAGRVRVVVLIASGGPISPAEMKGMKARIRVMVWLARHAPALRQRHRRPRRHGLPPQLRLPLDLRRPRLARPSPAQQRSVRGQPTAGRLVGEYAAPEVEGDIRESAHSSWSCRVCEGRVLLLVRGGDCPPSVSSPSWPEFLSEFKSSKPGEPGVALMTTIPPR